METKQTKKIGKNMSHCLNFASKFPGWHTYAKDRATLDAIKRLSIRGLIEVNKFRQFKRTEQ